MRRCSHRPVVLQVASIWLVTALLISGGCSWRHVPSDSGEPLERQDPLSDLVVPLAVRSFDISVADGHRGVFFKLSRVPSGVSHYISRQEQEPARIIVEVQGPAVGEDIPEEAYPGVDALVSEIRMSRTDGQLRLVVELSVDKPPPFSVHQMSDWLTVRFITEK